MTDKLRFQIARVHTPSLSDLRRIFRRRHADGMMAFSRLASAE
jgi:hypothetical protein